MPAKMPPFFETTYFLLFFSGHISVAVLVQTTITITGMLEALFYLDCSLYRHLYNIWGSTEAVRVICMDLVVLTVHGLSLV